MRAETLLLRRAAPSVLALAWLTLGGVTPLSTQSGPRVVCSFGSPDSIAAVALDNGYAISVHPAEPDGCGLSVVDPAADTVWSITGFRTSVDAWTGTDFDGDEAGDAVVSWDTGGGNRCCPEFAVLGFEPAFRVLAELPFSAGFEATPAGRPIIWRVHAFYGLGPYMAAAPAYWVAYRIGPSGLTEVTREHCGALLSDEPGRGSLRGHRWDELTPERLAASRTAAQPTTEIEEIRAAAIGVVFQQVTCGRAEEADRLLDRVFPLSEQDEIRARLAAESGLPIPGPRR